MARKKRGSTIKIQFFFLIPFKEKINFSFFFTTGYFLSATVCGMLNYSKLGVEEKKERKILRKKITFFNLVRNFSS